MYVTAESHTRHGDRTTDDRNHVSRIAMTTVLIEDHPPLLCQRRSW